MNTAQPIVRLPDEGETLSGAGITITHKVRSADTDGDWALVQYTAPLNFSGAPPHIHDRMTEAFYVLDGTLTIQIGAERRALPAGSFASIPPGVVHTMANESSEPVTFLLFITPGGFENYFDDVARLVAEEGTWPPTNMSKVRAIQAEYDMRYPESIGA